MPRSHMERDGRNLPREEPIKRAALTNESVEIEGREYRVVDELLDPDSKEIVVLRSDGRRHRATVKLCWGHSKQRKNPDGSPALCEQNVIPPKEVCYYHGGMSLEGPAHPNWKDGRKARRYILPPSLNQSLEMVTETEAEREELDAEIDLQRALVQECLAQLESGESAESWRQLQRQGRDMRAALRVVDVDRLRVVVQQMLQIIEQGADLYHLRMELRHHLSDVRKMVESKVKTDQIQKMFAPRSELNIEAFRWLSAVKELAYAVRDGADPDHAVRDFGRRLYDGYEGPIGGKLLKGNGKE